VIASLLQSDPYQAAAVVAGALGFVLVPLAAAVSVQEHRRVRESKRGEQQ
jgi:hypothetical protein